MKKNVIVIGSGIAGTLICNELAKKAKVTLLEAGEKDIISYPRVNFLGKALATFKTFCNSGGGGSNLWHNGLIPINNSDVTSKDFADILAEATQYTDQAATQLFFADESYAEEYSHIVADMQKIADNMNAFPDGVDCLLYPKKVTKLRAVAEVEQFYGVNDIQFHSHNQTIESVSFNAAFATQKIPCDVLIICAGTFGTPQLVNRVLDSIGINNKKAGKGLIDHPAGFVGKVRFKKTALAAMKQFAHFDKGNYTSCTGARIKSDCGNYTGFAFFRPALTMGNSLAIYKYKSLLAGSKGKERIKNALSLKILHPDILLEVIAHIFGINIPTRTFNILIYFQQRQADNNVTYGDQCINIDWRISDEELSIYNSILTKLDAYLVPIADETNIHIPITEAWLRSGAHHSGTISMGSGEQDILDKNLQIKNTSNAYVCDGSVIQEHSYANTGLTIGQLSLRLANNVLQ